MEIKIQGENITIQGPSVKLLRLKSQIYSRIGESVTSGKKNISFPISALSIVRDLLPDKELNDPEIEKHLEFFKSHETARASAISIMNGEEDPNLPYHWCNILDPQQITAAAAMTVNKLLGLCLFDEQGSGKTVMTIAAFDILKRKNEIDAMIIVCPKSMIGEWDTSMKKFCTEDYNVERAEGSSREKYNTSMKDFDVLITNYEGVESMHISLMASSSTRRFLLVIDESFYLKNIQSQRSKYTSFLRSKCERCFVLCGTPAPNTAHDLINQFDLADLGYTFGGFKRSKDPIKDWEKMDPLINERGLFIRRLKTEILEHVPEKNFHVLDIPLSGKQKLMYETARSELELELRNLNNETFKKSLATYFQKRSVMLQICSCPSAIDPTISETPVKYDILDNLLSDLINHGRKVIIWSFYRNSLDDIKNRYAQYKPVFIDGSVSPQEREKAVRMFQDDSETMLFIGNPAAAGAGITLHSSFDAVYLSYSNQAAHYLQSLDRIHRRGQMSSEVNYYLLICKNTIEETEVSRLRGKEIQQHTLLGDHIKWPSSLDDALNELQINE